MMLIIECVYFLLQKSHCVYLIEENQIFKMVICGVFDFGKLNHLN